MIIVSEGFSIDIGCIRDTKEVLTEKAQHPEVLKGNCISLS